MKKRLWRDFTLRGGLWRLGIDLLRYGDNNQPFSASTCRADFELVERTNQGQNVIVTPVKRIRPSNNVARLLGYGPASN